MLPRRGSGRAGEAVADAADGLHGELAVHDPQLAPQPLHRRVQDRRVAEEILAPDRVEEALVGPHPDRRAGEPAEQLPLQPGQREWPAAPQHHVTGRVYHQLAVAQDVGRRRRDPGRCDPGRRDPGRRDPRRVTPGGTASGPGKSIARSWSRSSHINTAPQSSSRRTIRSRTPISADTHTTSGTSPLTTAHPPRIG